VQSQPTASRFHPRSLSRAQMHLERAISALADADRTLAEAGAADGDRAAIARAQIEIFEQESWVSEELRYAVPLAPLVPPEIADEPAPSEPEPAAELPATPPSIASAIRQLFGAARMADLETESGQLVTVRLVELAGALVTATAPRLTVSPGMGLSGRMIDSCGVPWRVSMKCRDATEQADRMRVTLDVGGVTGDDQRQTSRMGIDASITLSVLACANLREGDEVRGQLVDLSRSGLAFSAAADLKAGDRLMFHVRFMDGPVNGELRVASTRPERGANVVGCWFASLEADSADVIARLMDRQRHQPATVSYPELRALFNASSPAAGSAGYDQG
jgi:hypothetical protein